MAAASRNLGLGGLNPGAPCHGPRQGVTGGDLPQVQFVHHQLGKGRQNADLIIGKHPRLHVDDAQGAQIVAIGGFQRNAEITADPRITRYQRVREKPWVQRRIRDDHRATLRDGLSAEGHPAWRFTGVQPGDGSEPLAVRIDQTDGRDRNAQHAAHQVCQHVEGCFGGRVERIVPPQGGQPAGFVIQLEIACHGAFFREMIVEISSSL